MKEDKSLEYFEDICLRIDGVFWCKITSNAGRSNLRMASFARSRKIEALLPVYAPGEDSNYTATLGPPGNPEVVLGAPIEVAGATLRRLNRSAVLANLPLEPARVTVVVPVYDAPDDLARCLAALIAHTKSPARLLLLDDASRDPRVDTLLMTYGNRPGVELHRSAVNRGYTATANEGIRLAGRDDIVLLNSDATVHAGWLEGLRLAAYSGPRIASVTAVSDNAGAVSVPESGLPNALHPGLTAEDMAQLVRQASLTLWPSAPTGNGYCLYLRRDALDALTMPDGMIFDEEAFPRGYGEENDFGMRAVRASWLNLIDDRTWVSHRRSASFGNEKYALLARGQAIINARYPDYTQRVAALEADDDLATVRWRIRRALRNLSAGQEPRPRVLFVISTVTGGTPQTNQDLMNALADRYEPWVLRSDGQTVELTRHRLDRADLIDKYELARPIRIAEHHSTEYDLVVADLLVRHAIGLVHVRHLGWHGLGLTRVAKRLNIPVIFSFHDFYTVCPSLKLLDENMVFCGGGCTETQGDCAVELWPAYSVPPLKNRFVVPWREAMGEMLAACDAFVTTSPGARDTVLNNFPALLAAPFPVIPHGRDFSAFEDLAICPEPGAKLRVLVPGNLSVAKGSKFIIQLAAAAQPGEIEIHVLGEPGIIAPGRNIVIHGPYGRDTFAALVRDIRPHLGGLFSLWPETYCHTLTELWAAGLPVFAFAVGSIAERIGAGGGGWLADRWSSAETVLSELRRIRAAPSEWRGRVSEVRAWQEETGRPYGTTAMATQYDLLYRKVVASSRAFIRPSEGRPLVALVFLPADETGRERLAKVTRNRAKRRVIYQTITPEHPLRFPFIGSVDALVLGAGSVGPADLFEFATLAAEAKIALVVDWVKPNDGEAALLVDLVLTWRGEESLPPTIRSMASVTLPAAAKAQLDASGVEASERVLDDAIARSVECRIDPTLIGPRDGACT